MITTTRIALVALAAALAATHVGASDTLELSPAETRRLTAPLDPSDPRAQLSAEEAALPEATAPSSRTLGKRMRRTRTVEFDLRRGRSRVHRRPRATAAASIESHLGSLPTDLITPRSVIGTDQRVDVSASNTKYPYRTVTKLVIAWRNGEGGGCSGTLISAQHVLTAAHCVYNASKGGTALAIKVIPGLRDTYMPYGFAWTTRVFVEQAYVSYRLGDYDYALLKLDRRIGDLTGWMGVKDQTNTTVTKSTTTIIGYPGDRGGGNRQFRSTGKTVSPKPLQLFYSIDTAGGQSGSALYVTQSSKANVFGVHNAGPGTNSPCGRTYNCATRLDGNRSLILWSWLQQ